MKSLSFVSCYLSIHQVPICDELYKRLGNNFHYISVEKISEMRLKNGYSDLDSKYPYVVKAYENEEEAFAIADNCEVLLIGSAPDRYVEERLKKNKLTFRCSERFYKGGYSIKTLPHDIISSWIHHKRFCNKPLYMLCASAYTATDCKRFGNYKGKLYKWGYFPAFIEYDLDSLFEIKKANDSITILWSGRLIEWKHPEIAINVAKYLKSKCVPFSLNIIGGGDMANDLEKQISDNNLTEFVKILGVKTPDEVRIYMEKADIFLFTSDYNEGWGAVVNEAMNSACAVVACNAAGSVPFLITNKENGVVFSVGEQDHVNELVEYLILHNDYRIQLGKQAYETICNTWNAKVAADRLMELINELPDNKAKYLEGPCSLAT